MPHAYIGKRVNRLAATSPMTRPPVCCDQSTILPASAFYMDGPACSDPPGGQHRHLSLALLDGPPNPTYLGT